MLIMVVHSGCAFSPVARNILKGGGVCYPSDEVFLLAVVPSVLEGRVTLQGCISTFSKLCAFGLIGVVGALVPVQVPKHEKEEADQDQGHCSDHSCNDGNLHYAIGHPWVRLVARGRRRAPGAAHRHAAGKHAVGALWRRGSPAPGPCLSVVPGAPTPRAASRREGLRPKIGTLQLFFLQLGHEVPTHFFFF